MTSPVRTVLLAICWMAAMGCVCAAGFAQSAPEASPGQVLDKAVAVVNNQVILNSDLDLEMSILQLLPGIETQDRSESGALQRLITRALIEQQIVQEDEHGLDVTPTELDASLAELRKELPGCKANDCASAAGWSKYLATLGLTPERLADYWSRRLAVLRFIERRFRSGIRIAPDQIQKYYQDSIVPQYAKPADAPPLERISDRIQEVLLQQQVNALLNDWLKSMQDQGQVEILDPALKAAAVSTPAAAGTPVAGGTP